MLIYKSVITNEPKFNAVYSRNHSPKIENGAYVRKLDVHELIGTHWIALFLNGNNNAIYFDSFGVEHF